MRIFRQKKGHINTNMANFTTNIYNLTGTNQAKSLQIYVFYVVFMLNFINFKPLTAKNYELTQFFCHYSYKKHH